MDNGNVVCEQCGNEYEKVGQHWSTNQSCNYPEILDYKKDILIGLLMGDGCVGRKKYKNKRVQVKMISPNYLEYVDNQLGWLSTGVKMVQSAEESAKENRESGFSPNAKEENYSDKYNMNTIAHPYMEKLAGWYSSGTKVWPENIELTPTVLKHLYCGDGSYYNKLGYISIAMLNESKNTEKVSKYFKNVGLPIPSRYDSGDTWCKACWTVEDSKELFEYMGEPLPDFHYKWPTEYR